MVGWGRRFEVHGSGGLPEPVPRSFEPLKMCFSYKHWLQEKSVVWKSGD